MNKNLIPSPRPDGPLAMAAMRAESALQWLGALVLALLLALVLTAVALRYVFGSGLGWSEEAAIWLHILLISIGAPLSLTGPLAMRLDIAVRALPPRGQSIARIIADGVAINAGLILAIGGTNVAATIGGTSTMLGLPEALRYGAVAIGGGLMVLMLLATTSIRDGIGRTVAILATGIALYLGAHHLHPEALAALNLSPSLAAGLAAGLALLLGAPLPHALLAGAALAMPFGSLLPEPALVQNTVAGISKFLLLAIPFFLLAGAVLTFGGLAERLVHFASSLVGHLRGGLAQTTLLASTIFSGASGSSIANAAFGAKVMVPPLVAHGYALPRATAIVSATAMLDNIIPPSIAFLILASATNLSVGSLLVGGFVAGLVLALALSLALHVTSRDEKILHPRASNRERRRAFVSSLPAIGLGVIVVVGIRFGIVTTTEASALAVAYALIVCLVMSSIDRRTMAQAFRQSAMEAAAIGLLIGAAAPFTFLLAVDRVPDAILAMSAGLDGNPFAVLLAINLLLLIAGLVLDIGAAILLLSPLLLPVAVASGLDPVHVGVLIVVNLMIGGLTPPVGILVYVASGVAGAQPAQVFRAVLPLLLALIAALAVLSFAAGLLATPPGL